MDAMLERMLPGAMPLSPVLASRLPETPAPAWSSFASDLLAPSTDCDSESTASAALPPSPPPSDRDLLTPRTELSRDDSDVCDSLCVVDCCSLMAVDSEADTEVLVDCKVEVL